MSEQLDPLLDALQPHTTPVNIEGIVDEQWHPDRVLAAAQLAGAARGPAARQPQRSRGRDEIGFNRAIAEFAAR